MNTIIFREVLWRREDGSAVDIAVESNDERGMLRLSTIRSTTAGAYTCEVKAESGELARRTVRIEVHSKSLTFVTSDSVFTEVFLSYLIFTEPPKIAPFLFPEELEVGGSTQATCSLISGDKPIQFTWHKDNLPIPSLLKVSL